MQGRGQGPGRATLGVKGPGAVWMLRGVPPYRGGAGQRDQPQEPFQGVFVQGSCPGFPSRHQPRGAALAPPGLGLQPNPCPGASWIRNDLSCSQACPEAQAKPFGMPGRGASARDTQNWPRSESSPSSPAWLWFLAGIQLQLQPWRSLPSTSRDPLHRAPQGAGGGCWPC